MPGIGGKGVGFFALIIFFTVLCSFTLILRWRAAKMQHRSFSWDDGFLVAAWVTVLVMEGTTIWAIFNGAGKPQASLTASDWAVQYKDLVAGIVCWTVATCMLKLAIITLQIRIFATQDFRRWAFALSFLVCCFGIIYLPIGLTMCTPGLSQLWDPQPSGHCKDLTSVEIGSMVPNIFLDTCVVLLPMPWVWRLKMPLRSKVWVSIMFSFGFITLAIMCYRLYAEINPETDASYSLITSYIVTFMELWIGIIVACMPTLAPILNLYLVPFLSKFLSSRLLTSGRRTTANQEEENTRRRKLGFVPSDRPVETNGSNGAAHGKHSSRGVSGGQYMELDDTTTSSLPLRHDESRPAITSTAQVPPSLRAASRDRAAVWTDCTSQTTPWTVDRHQAETRGPVAGGIHVQKEFHATSDYSDEV